ncbi:hypothetical protein GO001_34895 [Streptomyces sp. NRRL B-1677]|nr:hypothetical protein [Streptomyces sp. NRRL B-1677]
MIQFRSFAEVDVKLLDDRLQSGYLSEPFLSFVPAGQRPESWMAIRSLTRGDELALARRTSSVFTLPGQDEKGSVGLYSPAAMRIARRHSSSG